MNLRFQLKHITVPEPSETFRQVAAIHQAEIPDGFLSSLGVSFLARMYRSLADSPYSFLITAQQNGTVVGFICGSIDTDKAIKRFIFSQGFFIIPRIALKVISLRTIKKIFETCFYPKQKIHLKLPKSEILNFCVARETQQKGIGRKLFLSLCQKFQENGISKIKIVTGADQKKAQTFYEKMAAKKISEIEVHKNEKSFIYIYEIL